MTNGWISRINSALVYQHKKQIYRKRQAISGGNDRFICYNDKKYLNFSSNNYLGLARHPKVIAAWQQVALKEGVGAGGSGHIIGYTLQHQQLEERLANWLGFSRALLFNSGFAANQALIASLTVFGDHVLADRLSHASILEAAMQSPAKLMRFAHNNIDSLRHLLRRKCAKNRIVITEGVFSMDGDMAPLPALAEITKSSDALLIVDDAHGIGVIGKEGRGCSWELKVKPDLLVVTFGKAFGVSGAAVLCSTAVAEYLLQFARNLIYTTAIPPAQIAAINTALTIIKNGDDIRQRLWDNITRFRRGASKLGLALASSDTAIQPLLIGNNHNTLQLAQRMRDRGIWLTAIRPPTVPYGSARLRITITAAHLAGDIDRLLEALSNV